jgi:hypothetical protein
MSIPRAARNQTLATPSPARRVLNFLLGTTVASADTAKVNREIEARPDVLTRATT